MKQFSMNYGIHEELCALRLSHRFEGSEIRKCNKNAFTIECEADWRNGSGGKSFFFSALNAEIMQNIFGERSDVG